MINHDPNLNPKQNKQVVYKKQKSLSLSLPEVEPSGCDLLTEQEQSDSYQYKI